MATLNQLSDRLLGLLVPAAAVEAGCITDPYDYFQQCGCSGSCCYYRRCHVYSNCVTSCNEVCQWVLCR